MLSMQAGTLRMLSEMIVALPEVSVGRRLGVIDGWVVAVMDDCARHTAEHGLDDIQELSADCLENATTQFTFRVP